MKGQTIVFTHSSYAFPSDRFCSCAPSSAAPALLALSGRLDLPSAALVRCRARASGLWSCTKSAPDCTTDRSDKGIVKFAAPSAYCSGACGPLPIGRQHPARWLAPVSAIGTSAPWERAKSASSSHFSSR